MFCIVGVIIVMEVRRPHYPYIVNIYRYRYKQMANPEYIIKLHIYAKNNKSSFSHLAWKDLLLWEHNYLEYTRGSLQLPRPELPIPILERGKGRCGEFALLYTGLLLANGYKVRLVIDCSVKTDNRTAGDHVWNEIYIDEKWIHVDPTEQKVDEPDLYSKKWNKNVNRVYAIEGDNIVDVTDKYD